jgi:hypothetical protein
VTQVAGFGVLAECAAFLRNKPNPGGMGFRVDGYLAGALRVTQVAGFCETNPILVSQGFGSMEPSQSPSN